MRPLLAVAAALLFLAPAALADSHCWCSLQKSDCGDCNPACKVKDFGGVVELGTFQLHRDSICTQACNEKLAGQGQDALCAALKSNLNVPMPWGGEVHACWHVGTGSSSAANRTRVACPAPPPPSSYPPAGNWWKVTLFDDFKGKPADASPELASCYDRDPTCVAFYLGGPEACAGGNAPQLRGLNKCTWTIVHKSLWMSPTLASADPREVSVDPSGIGTLTLSVHAVHPDGSYEPIPASHAESNGQREVDGARFAKQSKWEPGYDCASVPDPWNGHPLRDKCPFASGVLVSQIFPGGAPGFAQQYGRFEVRARLPYGPGSFPAHWMLPVNGSWPGGGELDIMETQPAADHAFQTLHAGVCVPGNQADLDPDACVKSGGARWHQKKDGGSTFPKSLPDHTPFWQGFHVYAVEWDKTSLRFSIDGVVQNTIQELDFVDSDKNGVAHHWWNKNKWFAELPVHIPDRPFHWILNSVIHDEGGKLPNPNNFLPFVHTIDWVRASQRCVTKEDFCPSGGDLDLASLRCVPPAGGGRPVTYQTPCVKQ